MPPLSPALHTDAFYLSQIHLNMVKVHIYSPLVALPTTYLPFCLPTDTTTVWMSSATMTCWIQVGGVWPRDTRPASAWRTAPVTTATTDALPAPHTPRLPTQHVLLYVMLTNRIKGISNIYYFSVDCMAVQYQAMISSRDAYLQSNTLSVMA